MISESWNLLGLLLPVALVCSAAAVALMFRTWIILKEPTINEWPGESNLQEVPRQCLTAAGHLVKKATAEVGLSWLLVSAGMCLLLSGFIQGPPGRNAEAASAPLGAGPYSGTVMAFLGILLNLLGRTFADRATAHTTTAAALLRLMGQYPSAATDIKAAKRMYSMFAEIVGAWHHSRANFTHLQSLVVSLSGTLSPTDVSRTLKEEHAAKPDGSAENEKK